MVAEPEVQGCGHIVAQGKEVAAVRAKHHDKEGDVEEVDACALEFRIFAAVDDGGEEEAGGQEAGRNPEDGGLDVPCARQGVGQPGGEVDAVEVLAFDGVVGGEASEQHLRDKQGDSQEDVFAQCFLRGSQLDFRQRVFGGRLHFFVFGQEGVTPQQKADAAEQQHDAGERPHVVFSGRHVVDQGLVRPVVGVGEILVRTVGRSRPCGPEEEVGKFFTRFFAGQGVVLHREVVAGLLHRSVVAVQGDVVGRDGVDGFFAGVTDNHGAVFFDAAFVAVFVGQLGAQGGLLGNVQLFVFFTVAVLRGKIQPGDQLAVQPVGRPVRCLVCAVAENRADFHAAGGLPGRLAGEDVVLGHNDLAGRGNDFFGVRRCFLIDFRAHIAEDGKADSQYCEKQEP